MEAPYSPRRGLDSMKRHQDLYKKTPDWKRKYKGRIHFKPEFSGIPVVPLVEFGTILKNGFSLL